MVKALSGRILSKHLFGTSRLTSTNNGWRKSEKIDQEYTVKTNILLYFRRFEWLMSEYTDVTSIAFI